MIDPRLFNDMSRPRRDDLSTARGIVNAVIFASLFWLVVYGAFWLWG